MMRWLVGVALVFTLLAGPARGQGYLWCWDSDEVFAEVEGTSVTIHHLSAVYNCCPNPMEYIMGWQDGRLVIQEKEILVNGCWCICCYDLKVTFDDFAPGDWTVLFRWQDEENGAMQEVELSFFVPNESDMDAPPAKDGYWRSDCLEAAAPVPGGPEPGCLAWDAVKALYR
jgi:hypothetical protein